ncbi:hypothetical protein ATK74_0814 [Propionicimonas paludicola]|uniref:Uncharacterized protein n=1 Tax=Propionicimonas paludicola TaxID=185243 RepID=A0A2A9CRL4_9ACTN|nr:hypothetical protein [Propionicimonas paludicola]PFG16280.1 hypothetical protein ATK74_0814 [Propionicimonas paludicola]
MSREGLIGTGAVLVLVAGGLAWWAPVAYGRAEQDAYFSTPGGIARAEAAGQMAGLQAALLPGISAGLLVIIAIALFVVAAVRKPQSS